MNLSKANRDLQRLGIKFGHKESPGQGDFIGRFRFFSGQKLT